MDETTKPLSKVNRLLKVAKQAPTSSVEERAESFLGVPLFHEIPLVLMLFWQYVTNIGAEVDKSLNITLKTQDLQLILGSPMVESELAFIQEQREIFLVDSIVLS